MKKRISAVFAATMLLSVLAPAGDVSGSFCISAEAAAVKTAAPAGLRADVSGTVITLTWNKVKGADGYRVYIYDSRDKKYKKYRDVKGISCTIKSLNEGNNYLFKVAAVKDGIIGTKSEKIKVTLSASNRKSKYGAISIEQLRWDTDYSKLTNVVQCDISKGDFLSDLDGDGIDEVINFTHKDKTDSWSYELLYAYPVIPYINGKPMDFTYSDEPFGIIDVKYPVLRSNSFYICDIDSSDKYKEIAIVPALPIEGCSTYFYRYIDGKLKYIGAIGNDAPSEDEPGLSFCEEYCSFLCNHHPMLIDGSGVIKAAARLEAQTWFAYAYYEIDSQSGKISMLKNTPYYPYGFELKDDFWGAFAKLETMSNQLIYSKKIENCRLKKNITVYAKPSFDSKSYTIRSKYALPTGEIKTGTGTYLTDYDYMNYLDNVWIYITAEDGTSGWLYLGCDENGNKVNDIHEIFSSTISGW